MKLFRDRTFNWWQIALVKVCLISAGILLGLYFYDWLINLVWVWLGLFAITGIYFIVRFLKEG